MQEHGDFTSQQLCFFSHQSNRNKLSKFNNFTLVGAFFMFFFPLTQLSPAAQSTLLKMQGALPSRRLANTANSAATPSDTSRFGTDHAAFEANAEQHQPLRPGQGRF